MTTPNPELNNTIEPSNENSPNNKDQLKEEDKTPSATTPDIPSFGWSEYAERINGRFAMIGFTAILLIEIISNSNFLNWAGFG